MNVERNVLAVIPARGGSKGIPRKNMRLMHGRPLIDYAISCAAESSCITDVAVSTDSREILDFVEQIDGVVALERSPELSGDDIMLDPVVNDAVVRVEALRGVRYDIVITMQPTSPLLTVRTLDTAIERFFEFRFGYDGECDKRSSFELGQRRSESFCSELRTTSQSTGASAELC